MAESVSKTPEQGKDAGSNIECAVCLQTCIHPAQLPCGHIFCFLCVKGIANQSKRCAMCRQEIPRDFLDHPKLLDASCDVKDCSEAYEGGYQWFYEGRNGWWQYDERTSRELEASYKAGERTCELLIAGFLYVADFDSMVQRRRNDPARRRRIKRDLSTIPKKGIAGIKLTDEQGITQDRPESPTTTASCPTPPVTPADMPQTPVETDLHEDTTIDHESLQSTIEQMQSLNLLSRNDSSDNDEDNEPSSNNMYIFTRRFLDTYRNDNN